MFLNEMLTLGPKRNRSEVVPLGRLREEAHARSLLGLTSKESAQSENHGTKILTINMRQGLRRLKALFFSHFRKFFEMCVNGST